MTLRRRVFWIAVAALVLWWGIDHPVEAGHFVKSVGTWLTQASRGFGKMVDSI